MIFAAAALEECHQETADRTLELLLRHGVNHIDTEPRYGDSELGVGRWMERHRDRSFLVSKTDRRDRRGAMEQLLRSLERRRTDRLDLWQLHALTHPDEWERTRPRWGDRGDGRGARAGPRPLPRRDRPRLADRSTAPPRERALSLRFDPTAWNWLCARHPTYADDFARVRALARERGLAVQTIKALARGPWAAGPVRDRTMP